MSTSDDLVRRWREAKLGEVLGALDAARNERIERGVAFMEKPLVTMPAPEAQHSEIMLTGTADPSTVTVAPNPPRRERKRGAKA